MTKPAHPLDALIPDPTGRPPLCDEAEFDHDLGEMVAHDAPRIFAVVQEYGDRVDAWIAAWGMAFENRVDVVGVRGGSLMSLRSMESALRRYHRGSHIRARVVWVGQPEVREGSQRSMPESTA